MLNKFVKFLLGEKVKDFDMIAQGSVGTSLDVLDDKLFSMIDGESSSDIASISAYKKSLYVFALTNRIATVFSSTDFDLFKVLNTKGEIERIEMHEALDILYKPNTYQTKTEFFFIMGVNMVLMGETFLKLIKDDNGKIKGIINIRPDTVEVKVKDGVVTYIHYVNGKGEELTMQDMVHIKKPDPTNALRGAGVLTPIINRVTAERRSMDIQNSVLGNGGRPDGLLFIKGITSQEDLDTAKEKVKLGVKNSKASGGVVIMGGADDYKYQQLTLSATDMQLIENMKFSRDDIAMAMGIPKSMYTTDDVNLANAEAGYKQFINFTIQPLQVLASEGLTERFIAPNYSEVLILKHESFVTEDRKMLLEELDKGVDRFITVNEVRAKMGYDPIEGGDNLYRTIGTQTLQQVATVVPDPLATTGKTIDKNVFKGRMYLYKKLQAYEKAIDGIVDSVIADHQKKTQVVTKARNELNLFTDPVIKGAYVNEVHRVQRKNEQEMMNEMSAFFIHQGKRVVSKLEGLTEDQAISASMVFNLEDETKRSVKSAMTVFPNMALRSGNVGSTAVKMVHVKANNYTLDAQSIAMLEARASLFADSINKTTYKTIQELIQTTLDEGKGRDAMVKRLKQTFLDMSKVRATTIAQTEATVVSNIGLQQSFNQSDVVTGKMWVSAKDSKVRPEHQINDGVVVDKSSSFPNGEMYPAEKSINCRCVITPTLK